MQDTIAYLNSFLNDNDIVVIGLSGGPDSMCLLDILMKLNKHITIIVAHINHNIRLESDAEAEFVKKYCDAHQLTYEYIKFQKKNDEKDFNEQELRKKRYEFFESIIHKYKAQYLLTAHHGDDLVETILMRLTRGSNLKGYTGFHVFSQKKDYAIIKPLIYTTKNTIKEYNELNNIPYVTDKTNDEDIYTRNRYRHHVLPFLKQENKDIHKKYLKFSNELQEYSNYIDKIVNRELSNRYNNNILSLKNINNLDGFILKKLIEEILSQQYVDNQDLLTDKNTQEVISLINNNKPNITYNLPDNLKVIKEYEKLIFSKTNNEVNSYNYEFKNGIILPNGHTINELNTCDKKTNYHIRLNSKEIKLPLYIRTRQDGDRIQIKNMNGSKKVNDIFTDNKLSTIQRDTQPIVTDADNNIIWIPGIKKSKFDKEKDENYDIILWYN